MLAGGEAGTATGFDPTVWVDEYGSYLFAFALARVHDRAAAEDLVQETLLAAIQSRDRFTGMSSERTWLTGILKHKITDQFRRFSREGDLTGEEADMSAYQYLFEERPWRDHWNKEHAPVEWMNTPEELLEKEEFCALFARCLGELPRRIANAFTMHELDGFTGQEICDALCISKDNYWVMLHRARMHLRRCLEFGWFRNTRAEGDLQ